MDQGEVYLADFPIVGQHPVIVVSQQKYNQGGQAVVVLCTSAKFAQRRNLQNCVPLYAGSFGMTKDSVAQCEQMLTLDIREVPLHGPIGRLDETTLRSVIKAVGNVLDSDCEPN